MSDARALIRFPPINSPRKKSREAAETPLLVMITLNKLLYLAMN